MALLAQGLEHGADLGVCLEAPQTLLCGAAADLNSPALGQRV